MSFFFQPIHVTKPGGIYTTVVSNSHYNDPIDKSRPLHGESRRHGDVTPEIQEQIIELLIEQCRKRKLSVHDIAVLIAMCRFESGFNPDAAAGTTSALGLGQFVKATGEQYGITTATLFDAEVQAKAFVALMLDNKAHAVRKGYTGVDLDEMIYKYHHDGVKGEYGGRALAKANVVPIIPAIEKLVARYLSRGFYIPMDFSGTEKLSSDGHFYESTDDLKISSRLLEASYKHTEKSKKGGYFPLGANTTWHGGIHLRSTLKPSMPVIAMAAGEVIATRLEKVADPADSYWGSRNFVLMRHTLDEATLLQCLSLHIPVSYAITKAPVTFTGVPDAPPLAPGDTLVRTDLQAGRTMDDAKCRAKIATLSTSLSIVKGYDVAAGGQKLYRDNACKEALLDLLAGDQIYLVTPVDHHKEDPPPPVPAEVRLTKVAPGLVDPWAWRVKSEHFRELRKAKSDDRDPDPGTKADNNRVLDLQKDDIVEKVNKEAKGELIKGKIWHEVKIQKLAAGKTTITGFEINQNVWSLRRQASQTQDEKAALLGKGDLVDLVQIRTITVEGNTYDLVKPTHFHGEATAEYEVTATKLNVYATPGGAVVRVAAKGEVLQVTGLNRKVGNTVWVPVEGGWIKSVGGVKATTKKKMEIDWYKDLLGETFFVDSGEYGKPKTKARDTAVPDITAYIAEGSALVAAEGTKREEKFAPYATAPGRTDAPAQLVFYTDVSAKTFREMGQTRADRFKSAIGQEGELTIDKASMIIRTDLPDVIKAELIGETYYSLYMHLSDREALDSGSPVLQRYAWLPRVPSEYTLRRRALFYKDAGKKEVSMQLVPGDVLSAVGKQTGTVRHVTIKSLDSKRLVEEIEVAAAAILWKDKKKTEPLVALVPGDVLVAEADYSSSAMRHVSIRVLAAGICDYQYLVIKAGKSIFSKPVSNADKRPAAVGDLLQVLCPCEMDAPKWNHVEKTGTKGWISRKDADAYFAVVRQGRALVHGERVKKAGYVEWDAAKFREKDRSDKHKPGEEGWFEPEPPIDVKEVLDDDALKKLAAGQVVNLALGGQDEKQPIFPQVPAGAPLWMSGEFGVQDEDDDLYKRKPLIHWEVFSANNLMRFHKQRWSEARDDIDDYNMDNPAIIAAIRKALDAERQGKANEVLGSDNLIDEQEVVDFYSGQGDGTKAMRRFACRFVGEWGINLDTALPALRNQSMGAWASQYWGSTKNQIEPQLWWDEAVQKRKVPLPMAKRVFHYNPITFAEDLTEAALREDPKGGALKVCDVAPLLSVAAFMHAEMIKNANRNVVSRMRQMNRPWNWTDFLGFEQAAEVLEAYYVWYEFVKTGGPWDHKKKIRDTFGKHACDFASRTLYQYDIWSNIHYGYIGLAAGFEEWDLKAGAGIAQIKVGLKNMPEGYWKRRWEEIGDADIAAALDDPLDQEAIKVGFYLWQAYGSNLTLDQFIDAVRRHAEKMATTPCEALCDAPGTWEGDVEILPDVTFGGSVGSNADNQPEDVKKVRERLVKLGFDWIEIKDTCDDILISVIKLFQSIVRGYQSVKCNGHIDQDDDTHKWLNAANAPKWHMLPASGTGYVNYEIADTHDHHDYGTSWLADTIAGAGKEYEASFRSSNAGAVLIAVNDASLPHGGDTFDHKGHETGMDADLRLPRKDGDHGCTWQSQQYDQDATRAQLKAFRAQPLVRGIFFNDEDLIAEGLCTYLDGHDNHFHVDLKAPARQG